jgi:hypothetical protein
VIGHRKREGQHRIGMKRRESGVIGREEGAKRRKTGEAKWIGWRGWKIEAGGRDSVVIGRKERAKRRDAGGRDVDWVASETREGVGRRYTCP